MRQDILVTGGSDGSVRVWSLSSYQAIHRLAAHDNSVTSLQFDKTRIVSGGSDGRVKVWDLKHGTLVRELGSPAEAVWRVVFEEEKAVVLANRGGRTIMEVRRTGACGWLTAADASQGLVLCAAYRRLSRRLSCRKPGQRGRRPGGLRRRRRGCRRRATSCRGRYHDGHCSVRQERIIDAVGTPRLSTWLRWFTGESRCPRLDGIVL